MKPESAQALIDNVKRSNAKGNAHLFSGLSPAMQAVVKSEPSLAKSSAPKRIRQSGKPLMNVLEQEWFNNINVIYKGCPPIRCQAKRYRIGNGITFTPDFTCSSWPDADGMTRETAWEVKGQHAFDGALDKLKVAAATYPEIVWWLCWKTGSAWHQQLVIP